MADILRNQAHLMTVFALVMMFPGLVTTPLHSQETGRKKIVQFELMGGTAHLFKDNNSFSDYNAILNIGIAYGNSWHAAGIFTAQRIYEQEQAHTDEYAHILGTFRPNLNVYSFEILGGYVLRTFGKFEPYARLGLAYSRRSYEHDFLSTNYRDNKAGFAAYAGARYRLTERFSLSLAVRLFLTGKSNLASNWTQLFNGSRSQAGVLGGIAIAL